MKFARAVYAIAGIYGILVLLPGFFLLDRVCSRRLMRSSVFASPSRMPGLAPA
jgi:hypothetical protein